MYVYIYITTTGSSHNCRNPQTTPNIATCQSEFQQNWRNNGQRELILNAAPLSCQLILMWSISWRLGRRGRGGDTGGSPVSPAWRKQSEESEEVGGRGRSVYRDCCERSPGSSMAGLSACWGKNEEQIQDKLVKYSTVFWEIFLAKRFIYLNPYLLGF